MHARVLKFVSTISHITNCLC